MKTNFRSIAVTRWQSSSLGLVIFGLLISLVIQAHGDEANLEDMNLDELSNVKVSVDTGILQSQDRTPSSVLVITREQIERSGARDLMDILLSLPGFNFSIDTTSVIGMSYRGIWVQEGKILFLIDGTMQNDIGYNINNFGRSYPAFMIEKVEVLRGPGSALYGGLAQTGVISVTTRRGGNLKGLKVEGTVGGMGSAGYYEMGSLNTTGSDSAIYGGQLAFGGKDDLAEYSVHLGTNKGPLSMRPYTDFYGTSVPGGEYMTDRDQTDVVINVAYKDLTFHYDRFTMLHGAEDGYTAVSPPIAGFPADQIVDHFNNFSATYTAHVSQDVTVKTTVDYAEGIMNYVYPAAYFGSMTGADNGRRYHVEMQADWLLPTEKNNIHQLTAGVGYIYNEFDDFASTATGIGGGGTGAPLANNAYNFFDSSQYVFAQYLKEYTGGSFTTGARYEQTPYGNAFAPRIGVTYIHDAFNAKLLYGKAYRIPTIFEVILSGANILGTTGVATFTPEVSNTYQVELGYKISPNVQTIVDLFVIHIDKPIIYNGIGTYSNQSLIESRGVELQFLGKFGNWDLNASGTYDQPGPGTSATYVTLDGKYFLGSPPFKGTFGGSYTFKKLTFGPSLLFLSQRYGQSQASALASGTTIVYGSTAYDQVWLTNLMVTYKDVMKSSNLRLGIYNMFNTPYVMIEPYYGGHAPTPAGDLEVQLSLDIAI